MKYYAIDNNDNILIAEAEMALSAYYKDVYELPEDYEEGKYIVGEVEIEIDVPDDVEEGEEQTWHKETVTVKKLVPNPNWEEEHAAHERQRLDNLTLTPADVERALYKAKEMDFEDLKALITEQAPQIDMKALAIEFRANNFYRGAEVNGMRLIDTIGALLGYSADDMDYLFENKELPAETPKRKKEVVN